MLKTVQMMALVKGVSYELLASDWPASSDFRELFRVGVFRGLARESPESHEGALLQASRSQI